MTLSRRSVVLVAVALSLLGLMAIWSAMAMGRASEAAQRAGADRVACQALADAILSLRDKPAVASATDLNQMEIGQRIQRASEFVGLSPQMLQSVSPGQPRRVGQSPYLQKPTVLALRQIPLEQLAVFLFTLSNGTGMTVRQLHLRSPSGVTDGHIWDADATVTNLVYAPPASKPREQ